MSTAPSIEERLSALECKMDQIMRELAKQRKNNNWIEKITGTFENDPDFGEIVRLGREARQADRLLDDE